MRPPDVPNVVLVVLDSARADAFEPYGAPAGYSPAATQLASRGAALPDVFATASWTVPSHASLFTGLLPRAAGIQGAPGMGLADTAPAIAAQAHRLLAEVLRRAGFATSAVSTNLWISAATGFSAGFERFRSIDSGRQSRIHAEDRLGRMRWALEAALARVDDGTAEAGREVRAWIDATPEGRPFFWFVNLIECHSPYLPPRPFDGLGPAGRLRAASEARRYLNLPAIWRSCAEREPIPDDALARMRRLYAGALRYQDAWLADLLEVLDGRGILERTVVIVTADHGENLGEAGLITHALSLDDRLIRVPFLIAGPGARKAARIRSLAEVPRLVAELAALRDHPWSDDELPPGAAVAQLDPPVDPADEEAREKLAEWSVGEAGFARLTSPQTCATDGRWKLLRREGEELLYDTHSDPLELRPTKVSGARSGDNGAEAGLPRGAPLALLRGALEHPATRKTKPFGVPVAPPLPEEERDELEDRMRMLGYL